MADKAPKPKIDRKARVQKPPHHARIRPPRARVRDFEEVVIPYTREEAMLEASRCLQCAAAPCQAACPLDNDIPRALRLIEAGEIVPAAAVYRATSVMPEICGRICPQTLCMEACTLHRMGKPIDTRRLEAFAADTQRETVRVPHPTLPAPTGKRVAVVGAGPAGLTVSEHLTRRGHTVVAYEKRPHPGGLLRYGIPRFKLNREVVAAKVTWLEQLGVKFRCNTTVGRDVTFDELREQYDAVFIGIGTPQDFSPGIEGEELAGVYTATEFLVRGNEPDPDPSFKVGPRVHVLGGGDTAIDCLRTALRLPGVTDVTCYYRRSEAEMPAHEQDYHYALEEGARFEWLACPTHFWGDDAGRLRAATYQRMELCEPDESGRFWPVPIPEATFTVEVNTVVLALGYRGDAAFNRRAPELETKWHHLIKVDDEATGRTNLPGVFAAGDVVRGADLLAPTIATAAQVAGVMDAYLQKK
ncbi:MAG: FAD-dependent oxidoreductase [Anaerolineales bacterium]